jgi:DNA-binding response OmpR family regulator
MDAGSGRKILIIEDENDVADLLALSLRKAGFNTSAVADGASGLQKARDNRPDFIILDFAKDVRSGGLQDFERRRGNVSHSDSHVDGKSRRD